MMGVKLLDKKRTVERKNQRAYLAIRPGKWYQRVSDTQERPLMLQAVLPLCPNNPLVFIKFRPACPRPGLAALMLAGLNYI